MTGAQQTMLKEFMDVAGPRVGYDFPFQCLLDRIHLLLPIQIYFIVKQELDGPYARFFWFTSQISPCGFPRDFHPHLTSSNVSKIFSQSGIGHQVFGEGEVESRTGLQ